MNVLLHTLLAISLLITTSGDCLAGIYKYRDENGRLTFVDDESKVPAKFREGMTSISEAEPPTDNNDEMNTKKELQAGDPAQEERPGKVVTKKKRNKYQTPVRIGGNRVLVPVAVSMGNRTVKLSLLLDTGATTTVFHRESLNDLDLPSGKKYKARVAGGGTVMSRKIKFRKISVGPFQQEKAFAMVINLQGRNLPYDGMLGMDFLKKHPYQIDFKNKVINWEPLD